MGIRNDNLMIRSKRYRVRKIVDAHKGKVWAESEGVNKGASIIAEIPVADSVEVQA